ncbi:nickel-responsive transcriptional regulator NikR [Thermodesulfobacteriota bacterium]
MGELTRFGVSINTDLLKRFDEQISEKNYVNRSEAIRDLIRDKLVGVEDKDDNLNVVGTITIVYDHEVHELSETLNEVQHKAHKAILSTLHIHLDMHNCLEVLVVKGRGKDIRMIADRIISTKGVKHGKLTITTMGKYLS